MQRVILTHEQADFDALASMLGAFLLDEGAVPVLPRRMNRNVRAYLTLYGIELPFVDPRDLPVQTITDITLVDTQSMVTLKGMGSATRVRVIDHHPSREGLPVEWVVIRDEVGATTTLLVEELKERNGPLAMVAATLLLLGIYEDTGSLTYSRTTPRDLRAAAYLVEQGASLSIALNFLNHPLSLAQQELYERLRAEVEVHPIHGHTIIIARGDAQGMDEEFSSIAHKLRDLLDPEAIFLLVAHRSGVQMIARSTDDHIDVAEILGHFGGGGHERAAAVLIRDRSLIELYTELVQILSEYVRPAITVSEIMSRGPQVLIETTPLNEAADRMQRFGYEGYPVVKEGKVVGLLTRRSVDRALGHRLHVTAESLMDKGAFTVQPDDSIEHLQRIMAESGWGQIPVVQSQTGEIIGIVTRTDLLKILTPQPMIPSQQNLAQRLEAALPVARLQLLQCIAQVAYEQRSALYIVGGFVRDLLLNRPSLDFDLVVEGEAIRLARALVQRHGGYITSHAQFGTAKWHLRSPEMKDGAPATQKTIESIGPILLDDPALPEAVDLVTARTEFYTHPTALPTIERGSIKLDLHRRDFTINTLALRLDGHHYGELHDYWGGLNDLRHGQVRVLHSLSFVDDPTRMLRAVRFEARFGFKIEERTVELMKEALSLLDRVSGDRIRHELNNCLSEPNVTGCLARLAELSLLQAIHPALGWDKWLHDLLVRLPGMALDPHWGDRQGDPQATRRELAYTWWLLRLPVEQAQQVCLRLKFPIIMTHIVLAAVELWRDLPELGSVAPSQVVVRLDDLPPLSRYAVYLATQEEHLKSVLQSYVSDWQKVTSHVTGIDLRARGLPPGPVYRTILNRLRQAWLDGEIKTTEQEAALLEVLLGSLTSSPASQTHQ